MSDHPRQKQSSLHEPSQDRLVSSPADRHPKGEQPSKPTPSNLPSTGAEVVDHFVNPIASMPTHDQTQYILVVDDDNTLLKFFKIHLNKFFANVVAVKNAKEAGDALTEKAIDLVISDIKMPRIDGLQLMRKVRRHDPSIPCLLISGAFVTKEQHIQVDLADGFLKKPFSVDELHAFIEFGLKLRVQYKRLAELIVDKNAIRNLLRGRAKVDKFLTDKAHKTEVTQILAGLKRAS